jgi:hypothetical protein
LRDAIEPISTDALLALRDVGFFPTLTPWIDAELTRRGARGAPSTAPGMHARTVPTTPERTG